MKSSSRAGVKVRLLAVHTTEGIMRAPDLVAFFNRADAAGSSHAIADDAGTLLTPANGCVPYASASWTLRNGNPVSDNLEYCGWARYTRAEWLARPKGLDAIARWLAERSVSRGIPLVKLSPADVKAGKSGVIGHVDWTNGMADGTHWDPGPNFPWDVVIDAARNIASGQGEIGMAIGDDILVALKGYGRRIEIIQDTLIPQVQNMLKGYGNRIENTEARVVALEAAMGALAKDSAITEAGMKNAVAEALRENVVTVNVDVAPGARTS